MTTYVIVHGAFGGGWEWTPVAELLRGAGALVFTPTLTGLGDRHHLGPEVGIATNVDDLVAIIEFEDLHDVVLCAGSYGGMAATGAADRIPDRVARLIYIDALIPSDGQSGLDLLPPQFGEVIRSAAGADGHGWVPVPPAILPPEDGITEETRNAYIARLRPQPVATFTEPLRLSGAVDRLPRAFVRCTASTIDVGGDPIEAMAEHARAEAWPYRELNAPHDPQLFDPAGTADVIQDLATALT